MSQKASHAVYKRGSAIPHLNKKIFYSMPIPLPPLDEQQRMFALLDEHGISLDNRQKKFLSVVLIPSKQKTTDFSSSDLKYVGLDSKGINFPRVSEKIILRAEIFLPPPEEQKEIVCLLNNLLGREQRTKEFELKTVERVEQMKTWHELSSEREDDILNILVVGNGFDLAHGLPTGYSDFPDYLTLVHHEIRSKSTQAFI